MHYGRTLSICPANTTPKNPSTVWTKKSWTSIWATRETTSRPSRTSSSRYFFYPGERITKYSNFDKISSERHSSLHLHRHRTPLGPESQDHRVHRHHVHEHFIYERPPPRRRWLSRTRDPSPEEYRRNQAVKLFFYIWKKPRPQSKRLTQDTDRVQITILLLVFLVEFPQLKQQFLNH